MAWARSQKSRIQNQEIELEEPPARNTRHLMDDYQPKHQQRMQRRSPFEEESHDDIRAREYDKSYDAAQSRRYTEDYQQERHSRSPRPELIEREAMEGFIPKRATQHLLEDYKPPEGHQRRSLFRDQDFEINTKQSTKSDSSSYAQNLAEPSYGSKIKSPEAVEKEIMEGFIPKRTTQHLLEDYKAPSRFPPYGAQKEETIKSYEYTKTTSASKETVETKTSAPPPPPPKFENKPHVTVATQPKVTPATAPAPPCKQPPPPEPESSSSSEYKSESDSPSPPPPTRKQVPPPPQPKVVQKILPRQIPPQKQIEHRVTPPKQTWQTIPPKEPEQKIAAKTMPPTKLSGENTKPAAESTPPNAVHSPFKRNSIDEAEEAKRKTRFLQGMFFKTISGYDIVPIWSEKSPFKGQSVDGVGSKMGVQNDAENVKILVDVEGFSSKSIEVRFKPYFVEIEAKYAPKRRGFVKKFDLPTGTKAQTIQCSLFPTNGILQILVPQRA